MRRLPLFASLALLAAGPLQVVAAQTGPPSSPAEALVERERVRNRISEAFQLFYTSGTGQERLDHLVAAVERLAEIGAPAVPILAEELAQGNPNSFVLTSTALGRIGGAEAEAALAAAIRQADEEPAEGGGFERKAYAVLGLVRAGRPDAIERLGDGRHLSATTEVFFSTSAIELAALLAAPESVPHVHRVLERQAAPGGDDSVRAAATTALGRVGHPSSLERLVALSSDPDGNVRRAALDALARYDAPAATAALLRVLTEDELPPVRYAAAWSLEQRLPADTRAAIVARLDAESSPVVRTLLYRIVGRLGGPDALRLLSRHLGRPDPDDRSGLLQGLRLLGDPGALVVYRAALRDPASVVVSQAVAGLRDLATPAAVELLLQLVAAPNSTAEIAAVSSLVELDEPRAVPRIVDRLLADELAGVVTDPLVRERVYRLGDALVALGHPERLPELREAFARQRDGELVRYLEGLARQLELLTRHGDRAAEWIATLDDPHPELRALARAQLGRLRSAEGAEQLARRFGQVEGAEAVDVLRQIGRIDVPVARSLVSRVLAAPEFDAPAREALRDMAAWSARQLGGDAMFEALRESADRRRGRDAPVLVYLGVLGGERALPTLDALRIPRLNYPRSSRGVELDALDKLARDLRAGRPVRYFDVPPGRLDLSRQGWVMR